MGTSIWLIEKRASSTATASGSVGMSGTRISSTFDGRWVKTIVRIRPMRAAIRAAASAEMPASRFAPKRAAPMTAGIGAEAEVEPVGDQALDDEAAAEGVEREQGRQPGDGAAASGGGRAGGRPRRPAAARSLDRRGDAA